MRRIVGYAIVQHSGFGYAGKPGFEYGLELREVTDAEKRKVERIGGKVFAGYSEADDYAMKEQYPPSVSGLYPRAPGTFAKLVIGGLRVYLPVPERKTQGVKHVIV